MSASLDDRLVCRLPDYMDRLPRAKFETLLDLDGANRTDKGMNPALAALKIFWLRRFAGCRLLLRTCAFHVCVDRVLTERKHRIPGHRDRPFVEMEERAQSRIGGELRLGPALSLFRVLVLFRPTKKIRRVVRFIANSRHSTRLMWSRCAYVDHSSFNKMRVEKSLLERRIMCFWSTL